VRSARRARETPSVTSDSPAPAERRRWPLRVGLGLALVALVVVGVRVDQSGSPSTTASATSTTATSSATTSRGTPTTAPTTTSAAPVTPADRPVVNAGSLNQAARGCGMHVTSPPAPTTTSSSATTTAPSATTTVRRVIGVGRCTVLEIGDSLGNDLGWGLAREIIAPNGLRLVQMDQSATGLTASWYYNWPHHLRQYLARYHPNLLIVCLGGNDEQALAIKGVSQDFSSPKWASVYRARIRQIVAMATHAGSYVLWVGLPIMEPAGYNRGVNFLNAQYRAVVPSVPGGAFQPVWRLFANAQASSAPAPWSTARRRRCARPTASTSPRWARTCSPPSSPARSARSTTSRCICARRR
jgi:hypothetical protein